MATPDADLFFEHSKSQAQHAYFQLGLTASAIAFAVHETNGHSLDDTPWPIGLAVVLWAASFVCGCLGVEARQRAMMTNLGFLRATRGLSRSSTDPQIVSMYGEVEAIAQGDANRPGLRFRWQIYLLFLGAVAYVTGHTMQMAKVPSAKPTQANAAAATVRSAKTH